MSSRVDHRAASLALAEQDPAMARLVAAHGPMRIGPRPPVNRRFEAVARTIAYQQLAGRAASTIWGRVRALRPGEFVAEEVRALPAEQLRGAGLSAAKAAAVLDLADKVSDGTIALHRAGRLSDDEVVAMLTRARGVGPWTAHMFLIFTLHRLDVWPVGDLGVRTGFAAAFGTAGPPSPRELEDLGGRFRPYRSVVAWYCWRAADTATPDTPTD